MILKFLIYIFLFEGWNRSAWGSQYFSFMYFLFTCTLLSFVNSVKVFHSMTMSWISLSHQAQCAILHCFNTLLSLQHCTEGLDFNSQPAPQFHKSVCLIVPSTHLHTLKWWDIYVLFCPVILLVFFYYHWWFLILPVICTFVFCIWPSIYCFLFVWHMHAFDHNYNFLFVYFWICL